MKKFKKQRDAADEFLQDCVKTGRISQHEYDSVRLDRERMYDPPEQWVRWEGPDLQDTHGISIQECEIYINYPAWTHEQIADRLRISRRTVGNILSRVRDAFNIPGEPRLRALPQLRDMVPLDGPDVAKQLGIGDQDDDSDRGILETF